MHRWIAKAAGGTSQRLKRSPAMVRSLDSHPGCDPAARASSSTTDMFSRAPRPQYACSRILETRLCRDLRATIAQEFQDEICISIPIILVRIDPLTHVQDLDQTGLATGTR